MDPINSQPQDPQYQTPMPEHKHFANKKFIVTSVILILLGGGAYGGIWWWYNIKGQICIEGGSPLFGCNSPVMPTISPRYETADWKTYTNTQYGFEIKYPSDWTYDGTSEIYFDKIDSATGKRQFGEGTGGFNLSIVDGNISTVYTKVRNECQAYGTTFKIADPVFSYQATTLAGKSGWEVNCSSEYGGPFTVTILPATTSKTIEINSGYKSSLHNQILSTFKFTDSVDTSTWKTYTNTQYGFELKYPPNFQVTQNRNSFRVTMPSVSWDVLFIAILTQEEYKTHLADPVKYPQPLVLSQNNSYVATYNGPQECPDLSLCNSSTGIIKEIPKTFKFTK